jgi:hypothetical protein
LVWHRKCPKNCKAVEEQNQTSMSLEDSMRSELVFGALGHVPNRFLLTQLAAAATRKLHRPGSPIQETVTQVLMRFKHVSPIPPTQEFINLQLNRRVERIQTGRANQTQAVA